MCLKLIAISTLSSNSMSRCIIACVHRMCVSLFLLLQPTNSSYLPPSLLPSPPPLSLSLPSVTGGDLFDKMVSMGRPHSEVDARFIFGQIVSSIMYLHANNIVHRDLKPENILLESPTSNIIKVSDFGLSRIVGEGSFMKTLCGTPQYLAPEVISHARTTKPSKGYDQAVDVWSLGVILYVLLSNGLPFEDDEDKPNRIFDAVSLGVYSFPSAQGWNEVSPSAVHLIRRMLTVDCTKRIVPADILTHPWMKGDRFVPAEMQFPDPPSRKRKGSHDKQGPGASDIEFNDSKNDIISTNTLSVPDDTDSAMPSTTASAPPATTNDTGFARPSPAKRARVDVDEPE
jgi:serine/threonine protein kinase